MPSSDSIEPLSTPSIARKAVDSSDQHPAGANPPGAVISWEDEARRWKASALFYLDKSIEDGKKYRALFKKYCELEVELAISNRLLRERKQST